MCEVADRAISRKLDPSLHPVAGDTLFGLVRLGVHAARGRWDVALPMKAAFAAWLALLAVVPGRAALPLAELFVFPSRRARLNGWLGRMSRR